jgi:hypothetical protein
MYLLGKKSLFWITWWTVALAQYLLYWKEAGQML